MVNNLKLRSRILTGYSVPLLLSVIAAGVVYVQAESVSQQSEREKMGQQIVRSSNQLQLSIVLMQRAGRGYLLDRNPENLKDFSSAIQLFNESEKDLKKLVEVQIQKDRLQHIIDLSQESITLNRELIAEIQSGKMKEAMQIYTSNQRQTITNHLEEFLDTFNKAEDEIQQLKRQQSDQTLRSLILVVLITTLISIILALILGWIIAAQITTTIHESVNNIASTSTQIATAVEEQERTIDQQAAAVHQTTTTMDELGVSSRQSAHQAELVRAKIEVISTQMLGLIDQVKQIDHIANMVSEIANQTNMLALNAAVEAVRAGEHGKGFGVVAGEIRKLADQSKKSAEKITNLVSQIQQSTNNAVVISATGTKSVESVVSAINDIAVNTQQISLSAQQQATAIGQVAQAMNQLNQAAQQTVTGISQTKIGIQSLNQVAIKLKQQV